MAKKKKLNIAISEAANPEWLVEHIPPDIFRNGSTRATLQHIDLQHIWESSKRTTVLYEFEFNGSGEAKHRHQYVGYIVSGEKIDAEYEKLQRKVRIAPLYGPPIIRVPEANLLLVAYPNDRKMPLLDAADFAEGLPKKLLRSAGLNEKRLQDWHIRIEPLRYVPEKRFTSRCVVTLPAQNNGRKPAFSFIAKQLSDMHKARQLYNSLRALWRAFLPSQSLRGDYTYPVRIPEPLALFRDKPVVFIEEIPGANLKRRLPDLDVAKTLFETGALLANFHKAEKRVRKQITPRNEVAEVREALVLIRQTFPGLRSRVRAFMREFRDFDWQDGAQRVLLHGSYRLNHLFIHEGELVLLDLDSIRMGHPAYDIANFLASLYYWEAQGRIGNAERVLLVGHFLRGYAAHSACPVNPRPVLWFLASLLINKQAFKYVAHGHADREEKVALMLGLAEKLLNIGKTHGRATALPELGDFLPELCPA